VPTGNFGDIFAGYVAQKMGLPIGKLIIGTNSNDILARTVETGAYEMRDVVATTSPSMDIQISSNFERFLFEANGRDAASIRGQMAALTQGRRFDLGAAQKKALATGFAAVRGSEDEIAAEIRRVRDASGYVMETHTACASLAFGRGERSATPRVILSTAHPAKFPAAMEQITSLRPALPARLATLMTDPERTVLLPNDLGAVERFVEANARAVRGAAA
jgi:threonine synthase